MQVSSKLLKKTAILLMGVLLATMLIVTVVNSQQAGATSASDWTKVKGYVASYIAYQYDAGAGEEGEGGFLISAAALNTRINSVNDAAILGEGDDAGNAPVMVDNLGPGQATWIPGTAERCSWNTGSAGSAAPLTGYSQNCFDNAVVNRVKAKVDAHANAGFSTDVVDYCVSGKTEAPTTGAWGYIAQTGGLRWDGSKVKVLALKWGRNGWTNTSVAYTRTGTIGAATANTTFTAPTVNAASTACSSTPGDTELVRCQAQQSIYQAVAIGGMTGGNVGNGQAPGGTAPAATLNAGAVIDTRTGTPGNTVTSNTTYQIPLDTMFTTGLTNLPNPAPGTGLLVAARTPMMGGIVSEGLKMLGYTTATGGYISDGLPAYNNTLAGAWVNDGQTRQPLTSVAIDATSPAITVGPTVSGITSSSADIARTASEPATSKIHLVGSDAHVVDYNQTVLNAVKTVTVPGLHAGVTYTGSLVAYDGQANASSAASVSFTTLPPPDTNAPSIDSITPSGYVTSENANISVYYSDAGSGVNPASVVVTWDGTAVACAAVDAAYASCPQTLLPQGAHTIGVSIADNAGNPATGSSSVFVDSLQPTVASGYYPGNNAVIATASPTITFTPTDRIYAGYTSAASSGPNVGATTVLVDGAAVSCTNDGTVVSCPTSGLADGLHSWTYNLADNAGNLYTRTRSFTVQTCTPAKPNLGIKTEWAKWDSYADYLARELSVKLTVSNAGATTGYGVAITGSTNTGGVTLSTATPIALGDIAASGSASTWVKYHVPVGVASFSSSLAGSASDTCGTGYTYP